MASISLQDLRRRLYVKAKAEKQWRFWGLYVHVAKLETLRAAYAVAKKNNGAPGIDGVTFEAIEAGGVEPFLAQLQGELVSRTYRPLRNRRVEIPKDGGKVRVLGIPAIRDRVVQGALKLILEPIFEADFHDGSYGYRPRRTAHEAVARVTKAIAANKTRVVILVNGHWRNAWLLRAVDRRLREELAKLDLRLNEAKSRVVDLAKGETFGFLGFTIHRLRSKRGKWWARLTPALKQRTALLRKLKEEFRRWDSQPVGRVITVINPILRGWVNYFRVGNASRCFAYVQDWIEKKVRRHLMRARKRRGFGWKRWSRTWLYSTLGVFNDYRVTWHRV